MKDNGSLEVKVAIRQLIAEELPSDAMILEGFAGEGQMWRRVWSPFEGATIDKVEGKARAAAERRTGWAVYQGDTIRALRAGWMGHTAFHVVDLDAYGSPWPFVQAWFWGPRRRLAETVLVLTDGYAINAGIAAPCRALFPDRETRNQDIKPRDYLEQVDLRLATWAAGAGVEVSRGASTTHRRMVFHVLRVRDPEAGAL